jgi:ATP phosphoribosyltransferase regulatory subunit
VTPRRVSLPAGAAAYVFGEATRRRAAEEKIVERLRAAGYREAIVPSADYLAPYAPHLNAREERELYRFVDRQGDTLALRADFTIALARHLAARLTEDAEATRVFYRGEVLRGGAGEGSTAESYHIGAELLGVPGPPADLEIARCCLDVLAAGGVERVHVILGAVGALEALLAPERAEKEAGDLARRISQRRLAETASEAARVSPEFARRVRRLLEGGLPPDDPLLARLPAGAGLAAVARGLSGRSGCEVAVDLAEPASRSYYTGFFFAVYGATGGEPIARGGRYDGLYAAFGAARPAVGFSLGLEGIAGS